MGFWLNPELSDSAKLDRQLSAVSISQVGGYRHAPRYPAFSVSTGKKTRIFMHIQQRLYQQPSLQYHPSPSPKRIFKSQRGESEQKKWRDMPCCWPWNRRTTSRRLQGFQQWRKSRAWAGTLALPTFSLALSGGRARLMSCRIIKHVCCFNTTWWQSILARGNQHRSEKGEDGRVIATIWIIVAGVEQFHAALWGKWETSLRQTGIEKLQGEIPPNRFSHVLLRWYVGSTLAARVHCRPQDQLPDNSLHDCSFSSSSLLSFSPKVIEKIKRESMEQWEDVAYILVLSGC